MPAAADVYQQFRPLMFSIAYRMLSSVSEAEDVVQEAFLRYHRAQSGQAADGADGPGEQGTSAAPSIESPKAYLAAVTTRLCIDYLRSARARREAYPGEWLPEPVLTGGSGQAGDALPAADDLSRGSALLAADPASLAEQADSVSMAFLLLLERLSPVERAVFLLHEVFGYDYQEIGQIVGKTPENCRQLASRARRHVSEDRPRFEVSRSKREELAARFFGAVSRGDLDGLIATLAEDVVVYGDGGGKAPSWARPIAGRDKVARLLDGLARQIRQAGVGIRAAEINGQPGALFLDGTGALVNIFVLDITDGQVRVIRSVINPDKLRHLGRRADVPGLRSQSRAAPGV